MVNTEEVELIYKLRLSGYTIEKIAKLIYDDTEVTKESNEFLVP